MPSTGTGKALATAPARIETAQTNPSTAVAAKAQLATQWFLWIVVGAAFDTLSLIFGSHAHSFIGFGITALIDKFAEGRSLLHVITTCWMGAAFAFLGYCAYEGQKKAFSLGLALYALDAVLCVAARDYLSIPFHAIVLYMLYRGHAAIRQSPDSEIEAS
jgi:hypothetical protein